MEILLFVVSVIDGSCAVVGKIRTVSKWVVYDFIFAYERFD